MSQETKDTIAKKVIESYDIANSHETMHLAQDLARFIKENNLFHNIQGKAYVNVEGWQYAGARLGILPVIEELTSINCAGSPGDDDHTGRHHEGRHHEQLPAGTNREIKYQAKVKLVNLKTQQVTGSGYAICSNRESGKRNYQEFAIASMAQTRAIGKAYRNILAWIIRAAGYEPTPAEEMDYMTTTVGRPKASSKATNTAGKPRPATKSGDSRSGDSRSGDSRSGDSRNGNSHAAFSQEKQGDDILQDTDRRPGDRRPGEPQEMATAATVKQKTELLLLLNNKVVTNEEKNKMIENINKLDHERADKAIAKLKKVIEERKDVESHAA